MAKEIVRQSNYLTDARYSYTVNEKRVLYHVMVFIKNAMNEGLSESMFKETLYMTIPEAQIKKLHPEPDHAVRDLRVAAKKLRAREVSYDTETGWVEAGMISSGEYVKGKGLEVEISRKVAPLYLEVAKNFTAFSALVAMTLQSTYSQRFYEFCSRWKDVGFFAFTPEELAFRLKLEGAPAGEIKKAIEKAKTELKTLFDQKQCDLYFNYSEKRLKARGRAVESWRFVIHTEGEKEKSSKEKSQELQFVNMFLVEAFKKPVLVNYATTKLLESGKMEAFHAWVLRVQPLRSKIGNLGAYVRTALLAEYGIDVFAETKTKGKKRPA